MSNKTARTHTHVSNRARARQQLDQKVVFKSVLDNPFHISWPSVPINVQNGCLAVATKMADGLIDYRQQRGLENRKRKRDINKVKQGDVKAVKKRKLDPETAVEEEVESAVAVPAESSSTEVRVPAEPPAILQHLTIGISEVTRRLEAQIRSSRQIVTISDGTVTSSESLSQSPIKVVFVCRADLNPSKLVAHIPHLVAACNVPSAKPPNFVKLVPLPKGAELTLAKALGIRRVAVMAVDCNAPDLAAFEFLLESVPTVTASWLSRPEIRPGNGLVPTHIKQLRTSAPKDMKAAKERRAKDRAAAKERRKKKKAKQ